MTTSRVVLGMTAYWQVTEITTIYGGEPDVLFEEDDNDRITVGNGNSQIYGGNGNDEITAGAGSNMIYGGEGSRCNHRRRRHEQRLRRCRE
ncbi:MAG UNVERIFIED_CONTAM: hypothetical protein LVR18_42945 [Planctomycetaceae bacterium]|jgi:hypothetical protein